ncbi:hypothetical protein BKA61DRAFT_623465 [Leptodontidium sp. MPI-SDFR-AT-0119]|nr:hypothetical protein BKA61DRAFT_623465 [Leptodontidium sp. MPI-SDFR-AT-0119]
MENILTSILLLPTTSLLALSTSLLIKQHVHIRGHIPIFRHIIKYNSIFYSLVSLILCNAITSSYLNSALVREDSISKHGRHVMMVRNLVCVQGQGSLDKKLRLAYHASKFYEYIDILNVLAVGGVVNTHFWVHHFTVRPRVCLPFS